MTTEGVKFLSENQEVTFRIPSRDPDLDATVTSDQADVTDMANTSYGTEGSCAESTDSSSPFMSDGTKEKSPLVGRSSTKKGASSSSKHNNLELHDASQSGKERKTGEQAIDECGMPESQQTIIT